MEGLRLVIVILTAVRNPEPVAMGSGSQPGQVYHHSDGRSICVFYLVVAY